MKVENPAAFRFIMNEDIYLIPHDKEQQSKKVVKVAENTPFSFNYMGRNTRNFLILTNYPGVKTISEAHFIALSAILSRKGYQPDDVAILNIADNKAAMETITAHFTPQRLLILGKEAIPAGMAEPQFNTVFASDDCRVLYSFCFDDMMDNTDNKRAFWEQMKNL